MMVGNDIGAAGAAALAPELGRLTLLTRLYLSGESEAGANSRRIRLMLGVDVNMC